MDVIPYGIVNVTNEDELFDEAEIMRILDEESSIGKESNQ